MRCSNILTRMTAKALILLEYGSDPTLAVGPVVVIPSPFVRGGKCNKQITVSWDRLI